MRLENLKTAIANAFWSGYARAEHDTLDLLRRLGLACSVEQIPANDPNFPAWRAKLTFRGRTITPTRARDALRGVSTMTSIDFTNCASVASAFDEGWLTLYGPINVWDKEQGDRRRITVVAPAEARVVARFDYNETTGSWSPLEGGTISNLVLGMEVLRRLNLVR